MLVLRPKNVPLQSVSVTLTTAVSHPPPPELRPVCVPRHRIRCVSDRTGLERLPHFPGRYHPGPQLHTIQCGHVLEISGSVNPPTPVNLLGSVGTALVGGREWVG